jgi:hypothetical protein
VSTCCFSWCMSARVTACQPRTPNPVCSHSPPRACLSAQHTAVVRQLMTQLVPQLRDGDDDLSLFMLLDAIRARVTASQSALPLAA